MDRSKVTLAPILILIIFLILSCEEEPIHEIVDIPSESPPIEEIFENSFIRAVGKTAVNGFTIECITFPYPFSFELASGISSIVSSDKDAEAVFSDTADYVIDFSYPIEALYQDRDLLTVLNVDQLADAFIKCVPTQGFDEQSIEEVGFPAFYFENLCVELSFPLSLRKANIDSTIIVENKGHFADALAKRYHYFEYPLRVIEVKSGETITLNTDMELMWALFNCEENINVNFPFNSLEFETCFSIEYPITVVDEDGKNYIAVNEDVYIVLLLSGKVADFEYPITLMYSFAEASVEVNDGEKIEELTLNCISSFDFPAIHYYDDCFTIQYPVEVTDYFGNIESANTDDEIFELQNTGKATDFIYPITANLSNGIATKINSLNELNVIISGCYNYSICNDTSFGQLYNGQLSCFDINYPITIKIDDDEEIFNNTNEFGSANLCDYYYYQNYSVEIKYPVTVTLNSDGSSLTFENDIEVVEYTNNNCP